MRPEQVEEEAATLNERGLLQEAHDLYFKVLQAIATGRATDPVACAKAAVG